MIPNTVVPAYPYEGALYWLFSGRQTPSYDGKHPYYLTLYGQDHNKLVSRASALASLFDEIVMSPADAAFPSNPAFRVGRGDEYLESTSEVQKMAEELLHNPILEELLNSLPNLSEKWNRQHFLGRTISQIILAREKEAVLLGDSFFAEVVNLILSNSEIVAPNQSWALDVDLLDVTGLDLGVSDMDAFLAVRTSEEIAEYAYDFRQALAAASSTSNTREVLIELMRKALKHESIASRATHVFETVGSLANIGGLIPVVGTITTLTGIGADAAARTSADLQRRKEWYLIGPKMREVALKEFLQRD